MRLLPSACALLLLLGGCTGPQEAGSQSATVSALPSQETVPAPPSGQPPSSPPPVPEPSAPDATQAGPLSWKRIHYNLGLYVVDDPSLGLYRYPLPVNGSLVVPDGDGPFPIVLLLHGRHATCSYAGSEFLSPGACPDAIVVEPVDSYRGYDYLAESLASHGYAVASLNANTINDRDLLGDAGANARAQLVLRTLDELRSVNATGESLPDATGQRVGHTDLSALEGHLDLSRIGLMGHSRGGEGVTRAITLNHGWAQPHAIRAAFALAPTDFARWKAPGVAFAVLLPYCDGDVSDLQGAKIYDDSRALEGDNAPKFQLLAMGANHNFYNTVWTGDDWGSRGDAWCDKKGRDKAEAQRLHGLHFMASFFRLFVGQEDSFLPVWFGGLHPASLCPAPCPGRFLVSTHPAPQGRLVLSADGKGARGSGRGGNFQCSPPDCEGKPTAGSARQTYWGWSSDETLFSTVDAPLEGFGFFTFRAGVPVGRADAHLQVLLVGDKGSRAFPLTVSAPPGDEAAKTVLSQVRIPLDPSLGERLVGVTFQLAGKGALQVADLHLQS